MERLTKYNERLKRWTIPTLQGIGGTQRVTKQLKAYEDTELTPNEVNQLKARYYKNSICLNCNFKNECNCSDITKTISEDFLHPQIIRDDMTNMIIDCSDYTNDY